MYQRPEVRIIEPQQEQSTPADVTGSEAAYLLAKYGYQPQPSVGVQTYNPDADLTFEEMIAKQQRELNDEKIREQQRMYGPKASTFDSNNIRYSNSEYRDLDLDGQNFGIQVQVVSDMPIQNNNRRY
jgi:hypothetical protein